MFHLSDIPAKIPSVLVRSDCMPTSLDAYGLTTCRHMFRSVWELYSRGYLVDTLHQEMRCNVSHMRYNLRQMRRKATAYGKANLDLVFPQIFPFLRM